MVPPERARGPALRDLARRLATVRPERWLLLAMIAYFAVALSFSWLRALNFGPSAWDQGIYQQALWSTTHGRPFWETPDYETGGFSTFLQVHSVFLLYALVPIYAVAPYPITLYAVQSGIVAAAAYPLFRLGRDVTGSARWALAGAVIYLVWAPTLGSNLYDFHAESFLPLEIFTLVWLWNARRYRVGAVVAAVSFLTFELAPILVFFVGLLFLLPEGSVWRGLWRDLVAVPAGASRARTVVERVRAALRRREVRASLGLLVASAAAYGLLLLVRTDLLPSLLGVAPFPTRSAGYVIGATPSQLGLGLANLATSFGTKITNWLLLLALLGFVPLFAPRALVLSVPWAVFSFFSANSNYVLLGFQYGFIIGAGLLVAFVFGLARIARWADGPARARTSSDGLSPELRAWVAAAGGSGRRPRHRASVVAAALVLVVAANVAFSPADPLLEYAPYGAAYTFSYTPAPGYSAVVRLAALVPARAEVMATDDLFVFVANDVNAYTFFWAPNVNLEIPFNASHPPTYVLISYAKTAVLPTWILNYLFDPAVYGIRGLVWSTPEGSVLLFELGYTGAVETFDSTPNVSGTYFGAYAPSIDYYGGAIYPGPIGYLSAVPGNPGGNAVVSLPGEDGEVWSGPGVPLPGGTYNVAFTVAAWAWNPADPPAGTMPVLEVNANVWTQPIVFDRTFDFAALNATGGLTVSFEISAPEPYLGFEVRGYALAVPAIVGNLHLTITKVPG